MRSSPYLALVPLLAAFSPSSEDSRRSPSIPAAGLTYADLALEDLNAIQGCKLDVAGSLLQIETLILGTNQDDELIVAYVSGFNESGERLYLDDLERAEYVFPSIDEVSGVFLSAGNGAKVWANHVMHGRLPDGHLTIVGGVGLF